ncbi:MAG: peptidyl-prolyl cis-trans isomerase [Anaerofustis sp.]
MKKAITITLCIILAVLFILSTVACSSFQLNEDKDNSSVVATVNGTDIVKSEFKEYQTFNTILYKIKNYDIPTDEDKLKTFNENLFTDFVANLTYRCEAESLGLAPADGSVDTSVQQMITELKAVYPDESDYDNYLADFGLTSDTFNDLITKELTLLAYVTAYQNNTGNDYTAVTEKTCVTVDGTAVPMYVLYYFVIADELNTYVNEGTYPESEDDLLDLFDTEITNVANAQALISYGEQQGIEVTDDDINGYMETYDEIFDYFGDSMSSLFSNYYMTDDQISAARTFMGKAYYIQNQVSADAVATLDPSDSTLKKYYKKNIDNYDESTASVYHILVTDKTVAKQLEEEAGGTGEGFMALYNQLKGSSTVTEAAQYTDITKSSNYVQEFKDAIFAANEGDVVGMVKTEYGYHLIYVYEKNDVPVPAFDDIKDQVKSDYIASQKDTVSTDALNKIYKTKTKKGDYRMLAEQQLINALEEKYNVKTHEKTALR